MRATGLTSSPSKAVTVWCKDYTTPVRHRLQSISNNKKWSIRDETGDAGLHSIHIDDLLQNDNPIEAFKLFQVRIMSHMPRSACCSSPVLCISVKGHLINDNKTTSASSWPGSRYPPTSESRARMALELLSGLHPHEFVFAIQVHGPGCSMSARNATRARVLSQIPGMLLRNLGVRASQLSGLGAAAVDTVSARQRQSAASAPVPSSPPTSVRRVLPMRRTIRHSRVTRQTPRGAFHSIQNAESSDSTVASGLTSTMSPTSTDSGISSSIDTISSSSMDVVPVRSQPRIPRSNLRRRRRLVPVSESRQSGRSFDDDGSSTEEGDAKHVGDDVDENGEDSDSFEIEVIVDHGENAPAIPRTSSRPSPRISWNDEQRSVSTVIADAQERSQRVTAATPIANEVIIAQAAVAILLDMGFSQEQSTRALNQVGGDITQAIELLVPE